MSGTLLPFLYQTRTLQRLGSKHIPIRVQSASFHRTVLSQTRRTRRPSANAIPFELPPGMEHGPARTEDGETSTITPQEQKAFDRIFQEIAARGISKPSPQEPSQTALGRLLQRVESQQQSTTNNISIVPQHASTPASKSWRPMIQSIDPMDPASTRTAADGRSRALSRFPPSLRKAAREALGVFETERAIGVSGQGDEGSDAASQATESTTEAVGDNLQSRSAQSTRVDVEQTRRKERTRVENKLRAARSDVELWDVLENEVFTIVDKLGMSAKTKPKQKQARRKEETATGDDHGQEKLSMEIYGPLFPGYLVKALQLLDQAFVRSSPLVLNILPRVRELGTMSYVLGVSTPFYNALGQIYWTRYGDSEAVFNLFKEMRQAGLHYDETTLRLAQDIEHTLHSSVEGNKGPFLEEVVNLPEFEFSLLPEASRWSSTIYGQIRQRNETTSFSS
ncbi:hypothetical protein QBC47DRAFT_304942 [Echria macrotheca]|uniref:Mtf2-like C-terminal domain-containing protein n=1 Tax=Echria macrotheca TaxID=438768 RepID=A0AAJ0B6Y2_9PEZI|nr:hypothetical protein QBC47DRAFT_304942 [Echria macrotheca]